MISRLLMLSMLPLAATASPVAADDALPLPPLIWPLCGRLGEAPGDWQPGEPCPHPTPGPVRNDLPIHNGYGLRNFVVTTRPVSFHRGIDLATRAATFDHGWVGNPVFAVCDGVIKRIFGTAPDQTLELVCPQHGGVAADATVETACVAGNPCITAAYRHVQDLRVVEQQAVSRGEHLGWTGSTAPGGNVFAHLHFEFLDPRLRPSSTNHGRTAFSKDSINPLRYLPVALPTAVTVTAGVESPTLFADYVDGAPALVLRLEALPGYLHDFSSAAFELHTPTAGGGWRAVGKDFSRIAAETGSTALSEANAVLGVSYPIADGHPRISRFAPEATSRFYTPFSSNSALWTQERTLSWYRLLFDGVHPGVDGLLERNAEGRLVDGHLSQDFDFRLVRPYPNPNQSIEAPADPATWWGMLIGLREFGSNLPAQFCVRAEIEMLPADGVERRMVRWIGVPDTLDCSGAEDARAVFRDGFEADGH